MRAHGRRYGILSGVNAEELTWTKSSRCGSGTCVEVASTGDSVLLRDGKNPDQPAITFDADGWDGFLADVRAGHFSQP